MRAPIRRFYIAGRDVPVPGAIPVPRSVVRRLLAKIKPSGPNDCWFAYAPRTGPDSCYSSLPWKDEHGRKFAIAAHRLSFLWFKGPIPEGLMVLHRCDNKGCFRPDHLYAGTDLDNARDRSARERAEAAAGRITAGARWRALLSARATARRAAIHCDETAA